MRAEHKPSEELFVVRVAQDEQAHIARRLEKLGEVKTLGRGSDMLLLRVDAKGANAKAAWRQARKLVGKSGVVQPVLLDESGSQQYPTGEVVVRFNSAPSEARLKAFAKSHKLRLRGRNEYVPEQATFQLAGPAQQYIPDLVRDLSEDDQVKFAAPDTLASFSRA